MGSVAYNPPIGGKNTTYIPLIVLAEPGGPICYRSHLCSGNQHQQPLILPAKFSTYDLNAPGASSSSGGQRPGESEKPGDFCDSAVVFREICRPNLANGILVDPSSTKGFVVDLRQFVHGNFRYLLKSYQVKCLESLW